MITIWIDGDACPKAIKEVIFKAANRTNTLCMMVANQYIALPPSPFIKKMIVEQGFDKADDAIAQSVKPSDVVITSDLPLAESCLSEKAYVISPRGELFSLDTINQKLAMRDFNEVMRGSGIHTSGPKQFSAKDINQFANQLDRLLTKAQKKV